MTDTQKAEQNIEKIAQIIKDLVNALGIELDIEAELSVSGLIFNITSPDSNLLIGQKGNNLYAIQLLVQNIVAKQLGVIDRFSIDVDDYKKKREWYLRQTAKKALEYAMKTRRPVMLEPMPAFERRIIHAYLSENALFETESIGDGETRRIVIRPKTI